MSINGILNVDKPLGKTSFKVVQLLRKWSGEPKVGHAGTLDPQASGVLVVLFGQATKIVEFLSQTTKIYRAEIRLGIVTDTYDASGKIIQLSEIPELSKTEIREVLNSFQGNIEQLPPMFSAARYHGKHLYQLARQGIEVAREKRLVHIFSLNLLEWQSPLFTIEAECSRGTYLRSLAYDIGERLGCGAHLSGLTRLKDGIFYLNEAISLDRLEEAFHYSDWQRFLYPIDEVLLDWPATILNQSSETGLIQGRSLSFQATSPDHYCRAYSEDGRFLAVLSSQKENLWHPEKVFSSIVA
jgi:tRNA pseudouridine55 synthase